MKITFYAKGVLSLVTLAFGISSSETQNQFPKANGYRGIWYSCNSLKGRFPYKYSGGLATYCAKHLPLSYYAEEVNKTFFVYGGTKGLDDEKPLLEMVSYYDHDRHLVPRPTVLCEKNTSDAHHNPTIMLDDKGYVWVFISSHGGKTGLVYKSKEPYSIDDFHLMEEREFTYPQPWFINEKGFIHLFTKYIKGRQLHWRTSSDGTNWSPDQKMAAFGGHYQISWKYKDKIGTTFNYHPKGVDTRTNLYYMETDDFGRTWKNIHGQVLELPLENVQNPALVHNYEADGLLVYLNDINFDSQGNPVIQYVVSRGWHPGPENMPRTWKTTRWTGSEWEILDVTTSDNNYDTGSLHIETDEYWRIIGPTETGPQEFYPGGEIAIWITKDKGHSWEKQVQVTKDSPMNHTYVRRPVNAHPDFYAYWANGNPEKPSDCSIHFGNKTGNKVFVLPRKMDDDFQEPIPLFK
ncbi:hypothetical protein GF312_10650 [Candidatus Poribacteria bacterium]|nr:hypothetical protein [Candidatus Poribacteria bacterium]